MRRRAALVALCSFGVAAGAVTITVLLSLPALLPDTQAPGSVAGVTLRAPSDADRPRADRPRPHRPEPRSSTTEARRSSREVRRRVDRRSAATPSPRQQPASISHKDGGARRSVSAPRNLPSENDAPAAGGQDGAPPVSKPAPVPRDPAPARPSPQPAASPPSDVAEEPVETEPAEVEAVEDDEPAPVEPSPAPTSVGATDDGAPDESNDSSPEGP